MPLEVLFPTDVALLPVPANGELLAGLDGISREHTKVNGRVVFCMREDDRPHFCIGLTGAAYVASIVAAMAGVDAQVEGGVEEDVGAGGAEEGKVVGGIELVF